MDPLILSIAVPIIGFWMGALLLSERSDHCRPQKHSLATVGSLLLTFFMLGCAEHQQVGSEARNGEIPSTKIDESDASNSWNPAEHGGETYEAHQKSEAQAKLVQCIADDYNVWNQRQRPRRPSSEEREIQLAKSRAECRKRYPEGISIPLPEPRQASANLDAFRNAIKSRNLETVRALLNANVDPNAVFTAPDITRGELRSPALIFSINNSTEEIARLLVERGAAISAVDNYGNTALHAAAQWGHMRTIDLLLARGADITAKSSSGYTPLYSAIHGMQLEAVKYLVEKGAPVNDRDRWYGTPLVGAIMANSRDERLPIIRYLLDSGADPNIAGANGDYPLHIAITGKGNRPMMEVVRALLKASAKLDVRSKRGETPAALAERLGHSEVVALLKSSPVSVGP
jgi:ankyrin repeat protein